MDAQREVHQLLEEHFGLTSEQLRDDLEFRDGQSEEKIRQFFDDLEKIGGERLDHHGPFVIDTVEDAVGWLEERGQGRDEAPVVEVDSPFSPFRDKITPIQQKILQSAPLVGGLVFMLGLQMNIRGYDSGEIIAALGMIFAVQMYWGVNKLFLYLEKKKSPLLESWGYENLFWTVLVAALVIDFVIGIVGDMV